MEVPGIDPGSQPCEGCMLPSTTHPRAVRPPGLEPESYAWKAQILPLYYGRTATGRAEILRAPRADNLYVCIYIYTRPEGQKKFIFCLLKKKAREPYGTRDSHVVPHRSTDRAQRRLTSEF